MSTTPRSIRIPLSGRKGAGMFTVIDARDATLAAGRKWFLGTNASRMRYAVGSIYKDDRRTTVYLHKLIRPDYEEVDHHDSDGLNNRRRNLRRSTTAKNQMNRRKLRNNTSGFKGVCRAKRNAAKSRWQATIQYSVIVDLGRFSTAVAAARAYDAAARKYHKKFARLNFPRRGEQHA